ncbi:autophagy-related protein 27, partial [Kockovaella imperatae]
MTHCHHGHFDVQPSPGRSTDSLAIMIIRSKMYLDTLFTMSLLAIPTFAFDCQFTSSSIKYDLIPLGALRTASKDTPTQPTTSKAQASMSLCSELEWQDGIADEDQCPEHTIVCLTLVNHKESADPKERVTAVVPIWKTDTSNDRIWTEPLGRNGQDGVRISVQGNDYSGTSQHLNLTLLCDDSATDPNPTFISYSGGYLSLEWATPDACPRSGDTYDDGGEDSGGISLWTLIKTLFWLLIIGLIIYFAVGIFYNHQQYSAKGWDLLPHRDFWRSAPDILRDLFSHLFANVRGGGGGSRGGYNS